MINTILAYGQLIAGLPLVISWILLYVPNYLIEKVWPGGEVSSGYYMGRNVVEGAISLLVTYFMFELLLVKPTIWIPAILQIVWIIWKISRQETFMLMFITPGIVIGYILFQYIQPLIFQW